MFDAQCLIFGTNGNGNGDADQDEDENEDDHDDDEGTNLIRYHPYILNEVKLWLCWFVGTCMSFDHFDHIESEKQCY